jgi:hypothetical protein
MDTNPRIAFWSGPRAPNSARHRRAGAVAAHRVAVGLRPGSSSAASRRGWCPRRSVRSRPRRSGPACPCPARPGAAPSPAERIAATMADGGRSSSRKCRCHEPSWSVSRGCAVAAASRALSRLRALGRGRRVHDRGPPVEVRAGCAEVALGHRAAEHEARGDAAALQVGGGRGGLVCEVGGERHGLPPVRVEMHDVITACWAREPPLAHPFHPRHQRRLCGLRVVPLRAGTGCACTRCRTNGTLGNALGRGVPFGYEGSRAWRPESRPRPPRPAPGRCGGSAP